MRIDRYTKNYSTLDVNGYIRSIITYWNHEFANVSVPFVFLQCVWAF